MKILVKPMGIFATNCYIVSLKSGDIIIDAGVDAVDWVAKNASKPLALLNTHGHFDHTWSNHELQTKLKIPLYTPQADVFMLKGDFFGYGMQDSFPDVEVESDKTFEIGGEKVEFLHFAGHTPGCSAIKIGENLFSGDFVFKDSIGRTDFPYSSPSDMRNSILKFLQIKEDLVVYPGHGGKTSVAIEQKRIGKWLEYL